MTLTSNDLSEIKKIVVDVVDEKLEPIKQDVVQIRKDQKTIVNFFDHEYLELRKRIDKIESFLNLTKGFN